jgi:hypothetical protein
MEYGAMVRAAARGDRVASGEMAERKATKARNLVEALFVYSILLFTRQQAHFFTSTDLI